MTRKKRIEKTEAYRRDISREHIQTVILISEQIKDTLQIIENISIAHNAFRKIGDKRDQN